MPSNHWEFLHTDPNQFHNILHNSIPHQSKRIVPLLHLLGTEMEMLMLLLCPEHAS